MSFTDEKIFNTEQETLKQKQFYIYDPNIGMYNEVQDFQTVGEKIIADTTQKELLEVENIVDTTTQKDLLKIEINGNKKQVYYAKHEGNKTTQECVFIDENGYLCLSNGEKITDLMDNDIYYLDKQIKLQKQTINFLDNINDLIFYKEDTNIGIDKKIDNIEIISQDKKLNLKANITNKNIINTRLTDNLIKEMKEDIKKIKKQHKKQQKAQKKSDTNYTLIDEIETETGALKLLKQIYNTNHKIHENDLNSHIFYKENEVVKGNKYAFEITNENNETEILYFNKEKKKEELEKLMNTCNELIDMGIFRTNDNGLVL